MSPSTEIIEILCDLLIRRSQVADRLFERLPRTERDPRAQCRLAINMQSVSGFPILRETDDDFSGRGDLLDRQLTEIAERILHLAEPAESASVLQGEMIRPHPAVTRPADKAVDQPVLSFLLQHSDRL